MRGLIAAVLMAAAGTGCCKTCGWCHDDAPPARSGSGYTTDQPPLESPGRTAGVTGTPPAPVGRPVGSYGNTGN